MILTRFIPNAIFAGGIKTTYKALSRGVLCMLTIESGPTNEFGDLSQTKPTIKNVGWTLGNDCPYSCTHCYSLQVRKKGKNLTKEIADRIIRQLIGCGVETVNLGGNEPLFTNGLTASKTLLPYIIDSLSRSKIKVGLTTSGISLQHLYKNNKNTFRLLNDVDISLDSPYKNEHNKNRGANLFDAALRSLKICQENSIPTAIIMTAMSWNFSNDHIETLFTIAKKYGSNIRINPLKPVHPMHMKISLKSEDYYRGFSKLMRICETIDLGETLLAAATNYRHSNGCPCGRTSLRINSITPSGEIFASPCVYLHDYIAPYDILKVNLADIIESPQFKVFRQRNYNPSFVSGCKGCEYLSLCRGGCAVRSYLEYMYCHNGKKTMLARDPYCLKVKNSGHKFPSIEKIFSGTKLVHMDYLCTWIGKPS